MKANDNIPEDEMLLAEAIAAAKAHGKKWCADLPFVSESGERTTAAGSYAVCALGAIHLAGVIDLTSNGTRPFGTLFSPVQHLGFVINGNDNADDWTDGKTDYGESLGWAYRCAMEEP